MEHNWNNDAGQCICSFSYGADQIMIVEVPDENIGYTDGWIFLINHHPYYCSRAGGGDMLPTYLAETYAYYLSEHTNADENGIIDWYDQDDNGIYQKGEDQGYWKLTPDAELEFYDVFCDAMLHAGFVMEKYKGDYTGYWVRSKNSKKSQSKKCKQLKGAKS